MTILAIHGGAGALPRSEMTLERAAGFHEALRHALEVGQTLLANGSRSLDAVEASVVALEDCPLFNAGRGSSFNRDGKIEMEASVMDGSSKHAGSATLLKHVRNPVKLARRVMDQTAHVMLAGADAEVFARQQALALESEEYFFTQFRYEAMLKINVSDSTALSEDIVVPSYLNSHLMSSTVGAVALDADNHLAAASSSGGTTNKYAGRIGQSCIVGSGIYADDKTCAVSCTGFGEAFMRAVTAYDVAAQIEYKKLTLSQAAYAAIHDKLPGLGGLIAIDCSGAISMPFNTAGMYRAWIDKKGRIFTAIYDTCCAWTTSGKIISSATADPLSHCT